MNYHIVVIPHSTQRYDTLGDYWFKGPNHIEIRVSDCLPVTVTTDEKPFSAAQIADDVKLANRYEFLLMLHEFIEAFLVRDAGIDFHTVDHFDFNFKGEGEPGADPECPYRDQHMIAEEFEHRLAEVLKIDWQKYGEDLSRLDPKPQETESI